MAWATKTFTFSPSTTAASAEVNQNFDDAFAAINIAMPTGGIILWSGSIVSIPSGWYLCNGSNSTPDLRNKFIVGAGDTYAVAANGGNASLNLQHSHTVSGHTHSMQSHTHNMEHTHTYSGTTSYNDSNEDKEDGSGRAANSSHRHTYSGTTSGASASNTGAPSVADSGSATPGTDNQLSATQDIRPPYYALAWIMKS